MASGKSCKLKKNSDKHKILKNHITTASKNTENNQTAMPGTKSWWQFEKKKQQYFDPQEAQRACGRKHGGD